MSVWRECTDVGSETTLTTSETSMLEYTEPAASRTLFSHCAYEHCQIMCYVMMSFPPIPDGPVVRDPIAFTLQTDLLSPTPSFSLNCTSHSFPPTELSWSRDEQPLPLREAPYQSSQQLCDALSTTYDNLLTVTGSLPGLYSCTAANERGSQSNTLNVTSELLGFLIVDDILRHAVA